MLTFRPGDVVHEVIQWRLESLAASYREAGFVGSAVVVQTAEVVERLRIVVANVAQALPGESPVKVVNQRGPEQGRVAHGEAFAVVRFRVQ